MPGGKYGSSRKGNTGKFSMKFSGFKDAPTNYGMEETPVYKKSNGDKHPPASHHEKKKNTYVTEDDSNREKINDLEDRIEFLQSDLSDAKAPAKKSSLSDQIKNLQSQLAKLR